MFSMIRQAISGVQFVLIFSYFLNSLLVLLQQKHSYEYKRGDHRSDYVQVAFIITSIALGIALASLLFMVIGLSRNIAAFLVPHLFVQVHNVR